MSLYLKKTIDLEHSMLQARYTELEASKADLAEFKTTISSLDYFVSKLIALFKRIFLRKRFDTNDTDTRILTMSTLDMSTMYTKRELAALFNTGDFKMFTFVFDCLQLAYLKCRFVTLLNKRKPEEISSQTVTNDTNLLNEQWKDSENATNLMSDIKNIDDPSTDEEAAQKTENDEEPDEYLLIGSWFEDQLNTESNPSNILTSNTNATANTNFNNTGMATGATSGLISQGINSCNTTQVLDTTFELDQSNAQTTAVSYIF